MTRNLRTVLHLFDVPTLTHTFQLQSSTPSLEGNFGGPVAIAQGRALDGNMLAVGAPNTVLQRISIGSAHLIDSSTALLAPAYCEVHTNGTGEMAITQACGSASISANDVKLIVSRIPNKPSIFFHGANQFSIPFSHGYLCNIFLSFLRGPSHGGVRRPFGRSRIP